MSQTDARTVTAGLRGRWYGRYGTARCPTHEDRHPSLSLWNRPDGQLGLCCHAGCDSMAVLNALRGLRLVDGHSTFTPPSPQELARRRRLEEAEAAKRESQAQSCWGEALPIGGTLAEKYLRARGITCPLPPTLRSHPACWHLSGKRLPAIVARIEGAKRFAVHRTYLQPDGSGKANVKPNKAMLGSVTGGAVRLVAGPQGDGSPLAVAEGIETSLSLACGLLSAPVAIWAALSTSGLQNLRLPSQPGRLIIASDGDPPGRKAAHALAIRADRLGWQVSLLPAPDGQDWNDVLRDQRSTEPAP
jgi:hypothetical protein